MQDFFEITSRFLLQLLPMYSRFLKTLSNSHTPHRITDFYLAVFFTFSVLLACSPDRQFEEDLAQEKQADGWRSYQEQSFAQALVDFERAIHLSPELSDAHNGLGWSHLSILKTAQIPASSITQALSSFEQAIRTNKQNADAWVGLANTLFLRRQSSSDYRSAILALDTSLTADTSLLYRHDYRSIADIYALKSICYRYLGETELANQWLNRSESIASVEK